MIDAVPVVSLVLGTASSVGAVGVATIGIKALMQSFKHLRASGLSVRDALDANRQIVQAYAHQAERNAMTPEQRQAEDDRESAYLISSEARQLSKSYEGEEMFSDRQIENEFYLERD